MLMNTSNVTEVFSYLLTYYLTFIAIHYQYLLVYHHVYIQQSGIYRYDTFVRRVWW